MEVAEEVQIMDQLEVRVVMGLHQVAVAEVAAVQMVMLMAAMVDQAQQLKLKFGFTDDLSTT
jgi:hypothetical protein